MSEPVAVRESDRHDADPTTPPIFGFPAMMPASTSTPDRKTRLGSFLAGLGALAAVWPAPVDPFRYPHRDEADALRDDGVRIGDDMRGVIGRERMLAQAKPE